MSTVNRKYTLSEFYNTFHDQRVVSVWLLILNTSTNAASAYYIVLFTNVDVIFKSLDKISYSFTIVIVMFYLITAISSTINKQKKFWHLHQLFSRRHIGTVSTPTKLGAYSHEIGFQLVSTISHFITTLTTRVTCVA